MNAPLRLLFSIAVSAAALVAGDLTITFKSDAKVMGKTVAGTQTHYYNSNFQKTVDEGTKIDMLVDYSKSVFYTIKHKDKKVEMISFDDLVAMTEAMGEQMKQVEGMPSFLKGMMGGGNAELKVEQNGSDTVAGRACKKYKLSIGKIITDISVDPSLKPPVNPAAYAKFMKLKGSIGGGPMAGNMQKLYAEMAKIQGMALKTKMTGFMGMDSTMEATAVSTDAIPGTAFVLPAGYPVEDVGKKMLKQMKK